MFILQHLLQPSIITNGLCLIRENLKGMLIGRKPLYPCFFKGAYLFRRTSCSNFCLKSTVLNARKHFPILSFFNLTIPQQQLQLFIKYSKLFRRVTVDICTCKGDFRSIYGASLGGSA